MSLCNEPHVIRYATNHGTCWWGRSNRGPFYVITWVGDLDLAEIFLSQEHADSYIESIPLRGVAQPLAAARLDFEYVQ